MTRYKTIASFATGEYKEKGSRFTAHAFPVTNPIEAKEQVANIKREHPKARHRCYAYRTGFDGNEFRANDDGEPSGTAGKPILNQIDSFELTNVLIVVVRYFGGVLLGASGLNHAYKTAARLALESAEIIERDIMWTYRLTFDAERLPMVMTILKKNKIEIGELKFDTLYQVDINIPAAIKDSFLHQVVESGATADAL
jgi:uncharacterized YigZ family protein